MIKKVFKIFGTVLKVVATIVIVSFASVVLLQRFSNSTISVGGYRIFAVVTGSMEPVYKIGDVLLCKKIDENKLKVGDDVTYLGKEDTFKDKIVTHRLVKIEKKDGKKIFLTQGVATKRIDPPIEYSQIYGKVSRKLVLLSALHSYSTSSMGFFVCVVIPIMLLVGTEIVQTMLEKYEKKKVAAGGDGVASSNEVSNDNNGNVTEEQLQQEIIVLQKQILAQQNQNNEQVQDGSNIDTNVSQQPVVARQPVVEQQPVVDTQSVQPEVTQSTDENSNVVEQPTIVTPNDNNVNQ
jgi:signal peptidase